MCGHRNLAERTQITFGSQIVNSRKTTILLRWQIEIKGKEENWL